MHLVTREALKLYLSKLADHGILAFHISNRYLNLKPVLEDLARDAILAYLVQEDLKLDEAEKKAKKTSSIWVVIGRELSDMGDLVENHLWNPLTGRPGAKLWTDDFSTSQAFLSGPLLGIQIEQIKKLF